MPDGQPATLPETLTTNYKLGIRKLISYTGDYDIPLVDESSLVVATDVECRGNHHMFDRHAS